MDTLTLTHCGCDPTVLKEQVIKSPQTQLLNLFSSYLSDDEIKELLSHKTKRKAWEQLFEGYSELEIEACLVEIYSHFPHHLPSIADIKKLCLADIDSTKYQKEWNFILDVVKRSLTFEEMHNILQETLSNEARLSLKDIGGLIAIKYEIQPRFLPSTRKQFLKDCSKYKQQLISGLVEPLPVKLYEVKQLIDYPPQQLIDKAFGSTFWKFFKVYREKYGNPSPDNIKQITYEINQSWDCWEDKTEEGVKLFTQYFINNHSWLVEVSDETF